MAVQMGSCDERVEAAVRSAWGKRPVCMPTCAIRTASRETTRGTRSSASGSEHAPVELGREVHDPAAILALVLVGERGDGRGQRHVPLGRDRQDPEQ